METKFFIIDDSCLNKILSKNIFLIEKSFIKFSKPHVDVGIKAINTVIECWHGSVMKLHLWKNYFRDNNLPSTNLDIVSKECVSLKIGSFIFYKQTSQ